MKKHIFGRQLSRDTNERKALFRGLINSLVMQESIKTTEAKAKAIRGQVDKLITKAKRKKSLSLLKPWLQAQALEKTVNDLAIRFANRPGGYTRIVNLTERFGDNAKMVIIEFVEKSTVINEPKGSKGTKEPKEKVEAVIASGAKQSQKKTKKLKKEKTTAKQQRPPSRGEMEKRKAGKGSPKKESK